MGMAASEPEPASDSDLYQVDPSQFTAARNALVKRMRADGRRDDADRIGKLRRPPVTAWALNQIVRRQPELIAAVLEAGRRSRQAMEEAVGGDASGLRDAQSGQRRAVEAVVAAAVECLDAGGHPGGDTTRQRIADTLGAAVVDAEVAQQLQSGLLDGDRSAPGFGLDAMAMPEPRSGPQVTEKVGTPGTGPRRAGAGRGPADKTPGRTKQEREQDDKSRRAAQTAERERRRQARARHAELQAEASRLASRAERLHGRADEAERRAAEARAAAEATTAEADDAQRRADEARPDPGDEPGG
jgi:hypothetical protein